MQESEVNRSSSDVLHKAVETVNSCFDRSVKLAFITRELHLARLHGVRPMRVLIPNVAVVRPAFERWFQYTPHTIDFGPFAPEVLPRYDLLLPLDIDDVRRLDALRHLTGHTRLPIPGSNAIEICDDKRLFGRTMLEKGFGDLTPAAADDSGAPYVLKKRRDYGGRNTHAVLSGDIGPALRPGVSEDDYIRQELIGGRHEYASHVLFVGNRPVRSLSFEYDMGRPNQVKGPLRPVRQRMVPTTHLHTFSAVLSAIGYEGLCCIDYKIRNGRPIILEINPRLGGSLAPFFFSFLRSLPPRSSRQPSGSRVH